ncbi:MAG: hypothetical protein Ct9H90mP20_6830 [Candidatus Neomarinimicrobiota bacterium]|nr:MAG: hypothetical protein Ct9H90mP20_6830 [Candidatus Neomarinimicrobiota bacterium]
MNEGIVFENEELKVEAFKVPHGDFEMLMVLDLQLQIRSLYFQAILENRLRLLN